MGFTHVELMPVMEHPFYGSWGYQVTGYFAPTSRYGTPQDFMYFVDHLHQRGIGVILDWVPSHFPTDEHGLAYFDGTHLYEHADPRQGFHPEWNSSIFNYGRAEVRNFLASSALFWLDKYHIDGAARGRGGLDAVPRLRPQARASGSPTATAATRTSRRSSSCKQLNLAVYRDHPDTQTIAEESTAWPMVSRPTYLGGLGFGLKWNMGWMHDTLRLLPDATRCIRKYHHNQLTFSIWYAFTENFVLPLSHDEVVHGKGSLIGKMPGDEWQQFANLRAAVRLHVDAPGQEAAVHGRRVRPAARVARTTRASSGTCSQYPLHAGVQRWVRDLNRLYREHAGAARARLQRATASSGSTATTPTPSVLAFLRKGARRRAGAGGLQLHAGAARATTASACRAAAAGASASTATRPTTAAAAMGNFGGLEALASCRRTATPIRSSVRLPPLAVVVLTPD